MLVINCTRLSINHFPFAMSRPIVDLDVSYTGEEDVCFQLVDVVYVGSPPVLYLFGVTLEGHSIGVVVRGFRPYFYLQSNNPSLEKYHEHLVRKDLETFLSSKQHKSTRDKIHHIEFCQNVHFLWGFDNNNPCSAWKIVLWGTESVAELRNALADGEVTSSIPDAHRYSRNTYESDFPYVLRYMVDTGIAAFDWVRIPALKYSQMDDESVSCNTQVTLEAMSWDVVGPLLPTRKESSKGIVMLSFDLECAGRHGFFPDPSLDPVIQIANYATILGQEVDPVLRTSKPISYVLYQYNTCAPVASDPPGARVVCCTTERELLVTWAEYVCNLDPDILTGWNIMSFDLPYLFERAEVLEIPHEFFKGQISRCLKRMPSISASSSAPGEWKWKKRGAKKVEKKGEESERKDKTVVIPGRVVFDGLPLFRQNFSLRSYTLDDVSREILGADVGKENVKHTQITGLFNGSPEDRALLAKYCLKDAYLPTALITKEKLDIRNVEMARVTTVPLSLLMTRGQTIKVLVQIYRRAREQGYLIPYVDKSKQKNEGKYTGATVLKAKRGYYQEPVVVLDFSSLYPSIMMAHNLCYSTWLRQGKQEAVMLGLDPQKDCEVSPHGDWFVRKHVREGLLPSILAYLLSARKQAKGDMAKEKDPHMVSVHDGRQLALKLVCNSVYGFTGAPTAKLPCLSIASSVTSFGRKMIEDTKNYIESTRPGSEVLYGDSVVFWTPVVVCSGNPADARSVMIKDMAVPGDWVYGHSGKEYGRVRRDCAYVLSNDGFVKVERIMRHRISPSQKKIFRVQTERGMVDVTEDHSLVLADMTDATPHEVRVDVDELCHVPAEINVLPKKDIRRITVQHPAIALQCYWHMGGQARVSYGYDRHGKLYFCLERASEVPSNLLRSCANVSAEYKDVYVYDIETQNSRFAAGVGGIVVHNTDSVMVRFPKELVANVEQAIELGKVLASEITAALFVPPINLAWEKVLFPWLIIQKKKYLGLYWTNPKRHDFIFCRGIETVRRDNCPLVPEVLNAMIDAILVDRDVEKAKKVVREAVSAILQQQVPLDKLTITKKLSRRPHQYAGKQAHVELAQKMFNRDRETAPVLGDRVKFVIVAGCKSDKMCDRAEDPEYVKKKGIAIDTTYYIEKQLQGPITRIMDPIIGATATKSLFCGDHTRKIVRRLPESGGLMDYFQPRKQQKLK